ncbi:hypothetical protein DFH09DRAFT_1390699 [Mycena vulgaris]|nr:hypothetical protein DFH09DRAFT_1390699 [Mycena vulgaris]
MLSHIGLTRRFDISRGTPRKNSAGLLPFSQHSSYHPPDPRRRCARSTPTHANFVSRGNTLRDDQGGDACGGEEIRKDRGPEAGKDACGRDSRIGHERAWRGKCSVERGGKAARGGENEIKVGGSRGMDEWGGRTTSQEGGTRETGNGHKGNGSDNENTGQSRMHAHGFERSRGTPRHDLGDGMGMGISIVVEGAEGGGNGWMKTGWKGECAASGGEEGRRGKRKRRDHTEERGGVEGTRAHVTRHHKCSFSQVFRSRPELSPIVQVFIFSKRRSEPIRSQQRWHGLTIKLGLGIIKNPGLINGCKVWKVRKVVTEGFGLRILPILRSKNVLEAFSKRSSSKMWGKRIISTAAREIPPSLRASCTGGFRGHVKKFTKLQPGLEVPALDQAHHINGTSASHQGPWSFGLLAGRLHDLNDFDGVNEEIEADGNGEGPDYSAKDTRSSHSWMVGCDTMMESKPVGHALMNITWIVTQQISLIFAEEGSQLHLYMQMPPDDYLTGTEFPLLSNAREKGGRPREGLERGGVWRMHMYAASCAGVHRFGCGHAGIAPARLLARLLLVYARWHRQRTHALRPTPARVALAAPASGQRGTEWGCSGAAWRARPQLEVERARATVEVVLMGVR